jgi:ribose-phosphate pyrophosphokinase
MLVVSGSSNPQLAEKIATKLKARLARVELSRFPNSEARIWIQEKDANDIAVVVQSFSAPADNHIIEFCLLVDAVKRLGAKKIIAVVPWMGYCIQDKVFRQGEPLSARVIADLVQSAKVDSVITVDLHNETTLGFFSLPLVHLTAWPIFIEGFKSRQAADIIVAPDVGALKETTKAAQELGLPLVTINKKRDLATGKVEIVGVDGEVQGKRALIMDDFISTGGTLVQTAEYLHDSGVTEIIVAVTHHLFVPGAQEKLEKSPITKLCITDTVANKTPESKKITVVSVANLIAEAVKTSA